SHTPDGFTNPLKFNFIGTSLRIINRGSTTDYYTQFCEVVIDGEVVKEYTNRTGDYTDQALLVDIQGLENKLHEVIIRTKENTDNLGIGLDAIDINEDGMLLHPDEVIDIKDLEIGK